MWRLICGVIVGLAVWVAIISLLDRSLRFGWHDYAAVYKAMTFTLPMMMARLSESAVSSLISGYVAAGNAPELASRGWTKVAVIGRHRGLCLVTPSIARAVATRP